MLIEMEPHNISQEAIEAFRVNYPVGSIVAYIGIDRDTIYWKVIKSGVDNELRPGSLFLLLVPHKYQYSIHEYKRHKPYFKFGLKRYPIVTRLRILDNTKTE